MMVIPIVLALMIAGAIAAYLIRQHSGDGRIAAVSLLGSAFIAVAVFMSQVAADRRQNDRVRELDKQQAERSRKQNEQQQRRADKQQLQFTLSMTPDLTGIDLRNRDLAGFYLRRKTLSSAILSGARLDNARLESVILDEARMLGVHGQRLHAAGTWKPSDSYTRDGTWDGTTSFAGAVLRGADLRESALSGADFRGADLRNAQLQGAVLVGADLAAANLHGADLRGADLHGAVLSGVDLRGLDLSHTRGLEELEYPTSRGPDASPNLSLACVNAKTKWPVGFDANDVPTIELGPQFDGTPCPQD
jgi:uncharacterized protein YjbI with pentapeptide repeats